MERIKITGEELKQIAYQRRIAAWTADHCPVCDYPMKYRFQRGYPEVEFDAGCTCTEEVHRQRYVNATWEEVAAFITMQTDKEKIEEIKKFWYL